MLKINLADERNRTSVPPVEEAAPAPGATEEKNNRPERGRKNILMPVAVVLVLAALLVFVWTQREGIRQLFVVEAPQVSEPMSPPPAPEPEPAPVVQEEPDPVFVAINDISAVVPSRVWLTQFVVMYDGSYELKGMAFDHGAADMFGATLGSIGHVSEGTVPEDDGSAETIYPFSFTGTINGFSSQEILDIIPAGELIAQCGIIRDNSGDYGVEFTRFPEAGATYTDKDMPFELVGPYSGLKSVIAALCADSGPNRVYRLVVRPADAGAVFDRVRASFTIRRISSI